MGRFFFFSSRRRHTRCSRDWSSDVCSSDLIDTHVLVVDHGARDVIYHQHVGVYAYTREALDRWIRLAPVPEERWERSEERRVGKSVDLGGRRIIKKKNMLQRSRRPAASLWS